MTKRTGKTQRNSNLGKKIALAFLSVLLIALIAVAILLGVKSDGFKNWDFIPGNNTPGNSALEQGPFSLMYEDKACTEVNIDNKPIARIYVKNAGKYNVKIQPKESVFFDFRLDGKLHAFTAESGDYNKAFSLNIIDDYFEIVSYAESIEDVLNLAYFGHVISDVDETAEYYNNYFEIIVTAEDGQQKTVDIIGIDISLVFELNPDKVVF